MKLPNHKTKIVCTIGPASNSEAVLEQLMLRGMNVARLNFAHGTLHGHQEDIQRIRKVAAKLNRNCLIMADLPGPKIRIGKLFKEPLLLKKGDEVVLTLNDLAGAPKQIPVDYKQLPKSVTPGNLIFLNDGFIQLRVDQVSDNEVVCQTVIGGPLLSNKGLSIPGVRIIAESVSETDLDFVAFALQEGVNTFGVSFVETGSDLLKVKAFAQKKGYAAQVVAKIERAEALDNIDDILSAADAIMIARGDLGVQIPLQDVPAVQKKLIRKANLLGRPVITATQMLVSMTDNIRPTRAEVSDVANAILDGTDAVMLSEETAIGRFPAEVVEMIGHIAISTEREQKTIRTMVDLPAQVREKAGTGNISEEDVVTLNAAESATDLNVRYILTRTHGKAAPSLISRFRPPCWILSHGDDEDTNNLLSLSYGVHPVKLEETTRNLARTAVQSLITSGMIAKGERVIWVEDKSSDNEEESLTTKIMKA